MIKTYIAIFVMMWIRGTFPRVRIDKLLAFGWKRMIPVALAVLVFSGVVMKMWS